MVACKSILLSTQRKHNETLIRHLKNMRIFDKRHIFTAMREQKHDKELVYKLFFPKYGMTSCEFGVLYVLSMRRTRDMQNKETK
jgi:hypothetical protein